MSPRPASAYGGRRQETTPGALPGGECRKEAKMVSIILDVQGLLTQVLSTVTSVLSGVTGGL
jgi:hypothetical protein